MKYKIELHKNWPFRRREVKNPGIYRVPEDMDEATAERAIREAGASKFEEVRRGYRPKVKAKVETDTKAVEAPENK